MELNKLNSFSPALELEMSAIDAVVQQENNSLDGSSRTSSMSSRSLRTQPENENFMDTESHGTSVKSWSSLLTQPENVKDTESHDTSLLALLETELIREVKDLKWTLKDLKEMWFNDAGSSSMTEEVYLELDDLKQSLVELLGKSTPMLIDQGEDSVCVTQSSNVSAVAEHMEQLPDDHHHPNLELQKKDEENVCITEELTVSNVVEDIQQLKEKQPVEESNVPPTEPPVAEKTVAESYKLDDTEFPSLADTGKLKFSKRRQQFY